MPVNTATHTPTTFIPVNTPTFTHTVDSGSSLVDDVADCNNENNYGGFWYTYDDFDAGGTSTIWPPPERVAPGLGFVMSAPGRAGAADCAARITGVVTKVSAPGFEWGFVAMGVQMNANAGSPTFESFDFSGCEASGGIRFWTMGDGKPYSIKLKADPTVPVGDAGYEYSFTAPATWTQITVYFSPTASPKFAQPSWAPPANIVSIANVLEKITDIQFQTVNQPLASIDLWIDDLEFFGCPAYPTAGVTPAVTSTFTPEPPTATRTATPTITMTPTDVPPGSTNTFTPTITMTHSMTHTLTVTPSRTATPTSTVTRTVTRTSTPVNSATTTPTPKPTDAAVITIPTQTPVVAFPNPPFVYMGPGVPPMPVDIHIEFGLTKKAYAAKFMLFSPSMRKIREVTLRDSEAMLEAGIARMTIPAQHLKGLSAGTYYYLIEAYAEGGQTARSGINKLRIIIPIK